ncbi:LacI family transcriptional regulator [Bifidobacterium amazonense]|uniref:LacI family transcriptional regulator n=1 Tax=Bifidobacterium amazonense TaxID=2809027 RepID=A0ABS9VU23_9BIFI|nr:LacI family DNA-binding transcriptional regulator [Bifidobacterium amazonense]MCH9275547.1 LacI family transcriptional regulator [Bifidobacterium amazonense]MCH9275578.1 LacI family transcriptional regulator [Bifidobacterium amazonense]
MARTAKKVSASDIAKQDGVSLATVSKVINGRPDVADDTRRRIEEIIRQTGYTKRGYAPAQSRIVEVVLPPNLPSGADSLINEAAARSNDVDLVFSIRQIAKTDESREHLLKRIAEDDPAGIILILDDTKPNELDAFSSWNIPLVLIDLPGVVAQSRLSAGVDNWTGGLMAGRYLVERGHTRVATIQGRATSLASSARLSGFVGALTEAGLALPDQYNLRGDFLPESGRKATLELFELDEPPTAIFAFNDLMAMGVYQAASQLGLRIPDDLSVLGFDNVFPSMYLHPALSTIAQPFRDLMDAAIDMIEDNLDGRLGEGVHRVVLPPRLVERGSVAAPRAR